MTHPRTYPSLSAVRRRAGRPTSFPKWPSWFLLGWWLVMLEIVSIPGLDGGTPAASPMADPVAGAVETGSLLRTVLVLSFGAVGALMLPAALARLDRTGWRFLTLISGYLAWAALSYIWSDATPLTVRRLVLASLLVLGALGFGAGYYGQSEHGRGVLARDLLFAGLIAAVSTWISALSVGGVNLLAGDWELISVGIGTAIGFPVLLSALVSIYGRHTSAIPMPFSSRGTLGTTLVGSLITLVSLRKRALLAVSLIATAGLSFIFRRSGARRAMAVRSGVAILTIVGVGALLGIDVAGNTAPIVTRGEQELDLESLTGRVPLWEDLIERASERPFTGIGFGAFWTPNRMVDVEDAVGWPAVNAHNGYIDEILATGLVGLALLLAAWFVAMKPLAQRARRGDGFALLTVVWLGCFLLLNTTSSLTQDLFQFPFYSALVLAFACFTSNSSDRDRPASVRG